MLTTARELLDAPDDAPAVAAFNVISLEFAEGIVEAAERVSLPALLSISHNAIRFHGDMNPIAAACIRLAEGASAPIGVHLDHCEDADLLLAAADAGFGSAMFDASALPFQENVRETAHVASAARALGLFVEAELGEVGGKDGAHDPGVRTDPQEAASFVASTGVDALAVAIGTSHAMAERTAVPDLALIRRLRDAVPVPLVLHGSSGVHDDAIRAAVDAGIRKVNIGTALSRAYTLAVEAALADRSGTDPRPALAAGRAAITREAERLLAVVSATRRPPRRRADP